MPPDEMKWIHDSLERLETGQKNMMDKFEALAERGAQREQKIALIDARVLILERLRSEWYRFGIELVLLAGGGMLGYFLRK